MARYFFHLRNHIDALLDPEGAEFSGLEALRAAVLESVRDLIANDVKAAGVIDFRYRLEAEDEGGQIIHSLPFEQAVTILREAGRDTAAGAAVAH